MNSQKKNASIQFITEMGKEACRQGGKFHKTRKINGTSRKVPELNPSNGNVWNEPPISKTSAFAHLGVPKSIKHIHSSSRFRCRCPNWWSCPSFHWPVKFNPAPEIWVIEENARGITDQDLPHNKVLQSSRGG